MATRRFRELAKRSRDRRLDVEQRLKLWTTWLRRFYVFALVERKSRVRAPLRVRLRAWRHGFLTESWLLYELDRNDSERYLRDHSFRNYALFDRHRLAIMDKLTFARLMRALDVPQPELLAFVQDGQLMRLDGKSGPASEPIRLDDLLETTGGLAFRPVSAWAGRGVFFVHLQNGAITVDRQTANRDELDARIRSLDQYVITEYKKTAEYANTVTPDRPSTLRALTVWDIDQAVPFLAAATQRFGAGSGKMVDTYKVGGGGFAARVDPKTGVLGPGLNIDTAGKLLRAPSHPESGAPIEGVTVPRWNETVGLLVRAATALPQFPLIGWDIIMTDDGPFWLEGNSPPGVQLWQVHTPLLEDPRSRRFFEWLGCVEPLDGGR